MITQEFSDGTHVIKIEQAESLEDAKQNRFPDGEYTRYFVDGKKYPSYMEMISFIIKKTGSSRTSFFPKSFNELENIRNKVLKSQQAEMQTAMVAMKKKYADMNFPPQAMKELDDMIEKLDLSGIRVSE
jgi:membrane-bound lytic murein transglycosylase MltF